MPDGVEQNGSTLGRRDGDGARAPCELPRLLRYSHIFSSAVREVLEVNLLKEITPLPLSLTQFHLLKLMTFDGRHQVGEIAGVLGMSAPAASKNVDKLEGLGLVMREPHEEDRRATLLSVSEEGRELVDRYEEAKTSILGPALKRFDQDEVDTLTELLERFSVSLLELEGPGAEVCLRCAAYIESDCAVGEVCGGCPYMKFHEAQKDNESGQRS
jgi:DNA-binding MarR family transcriptional regulator